MNKCVEQKRNADNANGYNKTINKLPIMCVLTKLYWIAISNEKKNYLCVWMNENGVGKKRRSLLFFNVLNGTETHINLLLASNLHHSWFNSSCPHSFATFIHFTLDYQLSEFVVSMNVFSKSRLFFIFSICRMISRSLRPSNQINFVDRAAWLWPVFAFSIIILCHEMY